MRDTMDIMEDLLIILNINDKNIITSESLQLQLNLQSMIKYIRK